MGAIKWPGLCGYNVTGGILICRGNRTPLGVMNKARANTLCFCVGSVCGPLLGPNVKEARRKCKQAVLTEVNPPLQIHANYSWDIWYVASVSGEAEKI